MTGRSAADDVAIGDDLQNELRRQPSLIAYWNEQLHQQEAKMRRLRLTMKGVQAELQAEWSLGAKASGKPLGEAAMDRMLYRNKAWRDQRAAVDEAEIEHSRLKGFLDALAHKRDVLVALSHDRRQEMRSFVR